MVTQGEWKVETDVFGDMFIIAGDKHKHSLIADIQVCNDDCEDNANLIVAAVNACSLVNPDNPMAVAESIKDMKEALKDCITSMQSSRLYGAENLEGAIIVAQIARAKAEGKDE